LAASVGRVGSRAAAGDLDPIALLQETLVALQREGVEFALASVVKDSMRRKSPAFDESDHSFSTFSKFLEDAAAKGIVRLEADPRSGTYRVELADASRATLAATTPAQAERAAEEGEGRRRRRRRRGAPPPETTDAQ